MSESIPEYVPPPIDIDLMRHKIVDGEVYVNLEDLVKILTIQVNDLDRAATIAVNLYKQRGFPIGAELFKQGSTVARLVFALKNYTETTKFDSVINGEENE
jgi:hypothetical protein